MVKRTNAQLERIADDNATYQEYLDGVAAEETRQFLEKNQERVDGLEQRRDDLAMKQEELDWAKQIYDEYAVEDATQRPGDWTEQLLEDYEWEYNNFQAELAEIKRDIKEIEGLKKEFDDAAAE